MRTAAFAATLLACATAGELRPVPQVLDEQALAMRCENGFAADCRTLGRARLAGDALPRDDRLGTALLIQACEIGDPAACSDLGVLYALGRGVPQDDERAGALSRRACEQGAAIACSNQGALLAAGAARLPDAADLEMRIVRLFRTACDAGVPEGCMNLGAALEAGRPPIPPDAKAAAHADRRACEAGFALGCHRLALLVADRPDAAPDLTATALEARACRAGIAPACYAVSEATPPATARTPAAQLVDDRASFALGIPGTGGFSPGELTPVRAVGPVRSLGDVQRPPRHVQDEVPPDLRDRLGVALPAREADASSRPVELLVALRRHQLGQCNEAARAAAGARTEAFATFFVDRDGSPVNVRAASMPPDGPLEECVGTIVAGWEFPADPGGHTGQYLARFTYDPAPGPRPEFAAPGGLRPALREPTCVDKGVRIPPEYQGATGSVTIKVAVDAAGKPGLVYALTPVPDAILSSVAASVLGCAWSAGGDTDGRPIPLWVTLTVKLDAH
jgi:TPR repeat protein